MERRTFMQAGAIALGTLPMSAAPRKTAALIGNHVALPNNRYYQISNVSTEPNALVIGLPGTALSIDNLNTSFWNGPVGGWQAHATSKGYTLALAESLGDWNVGPDKNGLQWTTQTQDDLQFLVNIVADASTKSNIDTSKIFIAGFSAGASMAWKALCERPDIFKAGGSASGWATVYPTVPVDMMHFHGTADTTVPIRGGTGYRAPYVFNEAMQESIKTPRGSRTPLYPTSGGHGVPGWIADRLWYFWNVERFLP